MDTDAKKSSRSNQEEGSSNQQRANNQVGLHRLLVPVADPTPERTGNAISTIFQAKEKADVDRTEVEASEDLGLEVDGQETITHGGDDERHKAKPNGGNAQHLEHRNLVLLLPVVVFTSFLVLIIWWRHGANTGDG